MDAERSTLGIVRDEEASKREEKVLSCDVARRIELEIDGLDLTQRSGELVVYDAYSQSGVSYTRNARGSISDDRDLIDWTSSCNAALAQATAV